MPDQDKMIQGAQELETLQKENEEEEQLEDLMLLGDDMTGWSLFESGEDPWRPLVKRFLRAAIQPLLEEIASLKSELADRDASLVKTYEKP